MLDGWEYSDNGCPKCRSEMAWRHCNQCEGGEIEDDDGINDLSYERCDNCNGTGHEEWCRECGWDNTYKQFLSPEYEKAFLEKHSTQSHAEGGLSQGAE